MIKLNNKDEFRRLLISTPSDMGEGAVTGLHEALDDWLKRAKVIAPVDIGFLRSEMKTQIDTGLMEGTLLANSYSTRGFNYAYFLHEIGSAKGYRARKPGKSLTWIDDTMDPTRSMAIIEEEMKKKMDSKWR